MQLDPTRWLVSLAGFIYDWIITREWSRIALCWLPVMGLAVMLTAVAAGNWRDPQRLAQWYLELGNEEIAEWEQAWAPSDAAEDAPLASGSTAEAAASASPVAAGAGTESGQAAADPDSAADSPAARDPLANQVSRFAETLFRRVQMVLPSERSQFVIAMTLAQRGGIEQAQSLLAKIAPDNRPGYAPAHALAAQIMFQELPQANASQTQELAARLKHHVVEASRWDRCPQAVLQAGSHFSLVTGDIPGGLALLARSAERHPEDNFLLAVLAHRAGDRRLFEQVWPRAEEHLLARVAEQPADESARLQLAQIYSTASELDRAEEVLLQVPEAERTPQILRALSQIYVQRYGQSQSQQNEKVSVNLKFLDMAMRIDPSNPLIAEEVAKLARMQGPQPTEELIELLKTHLASGTATAVTHACLAEMRLLRNELDKAIPHLEQVINRLPNSAEYLNNLAYCLAELEPERYEEALKYATQAIAESRREPNADFYDTLAHVLSRLERHKEAITAIETAIELAPARVDFHRRAAAEYAAVGDNSMVQVHEQVIERLKVEEQQRLEAERLAAQRRAIEERLAAEREAAQQQRQAELERFRAEAEQALADMVAEDATLTLPGGGR